MFTLQTKAWGACIKAMKNIYSQNPTSNINPVEGKMQGDTVSNRVESGGTEQQDITYTDRVVW